jgi:hypothetical protein
MAIALLDDEATLEVADHELGQDDGDEGTIYTLRVVSPQVIKRLRKEHTKKRPTGGQGMADVLNTEAFGEALWDYVLKSWRGPMWRGKAIDADEIVNGVKAKTLLDGSRKAALLERAGANEVVTPDATFRPSA